MDKKKIIWFLFAFTSICLSAPNVNITCPMPATIINGIVKVSGKLKSNAQYECIEGYEIQGLKKRICLASGNWSGEEPKCIRKRFCEKPLLSENAIIKYKKTGPGNSFIVGSKIITKCKKGFLRFGKHRIKCKENREWTHKPPICVDANKKCPMPAPIINGTVKASGKLKSLATYECIEGYKIQGLEKRKCLASGNWSGEEPKCITKRCERPRGLSRFRNGKFEIENKEFDLGSSITFTCDEGYYIKAEDVMTCLENERWSPTKMPRCYRINCGDPGRPKSGSRLGGEFTVGKVVKFRCDYGYTLIGSRNRTCGSNFLWSGEMAVCVSDKRKYDCQDPGIPAQSTREGNSFNRGDKVRYVCQSGYTLRGSSVRKCIGNGTWTGLPVFCEDESKVIIPSLNETTEQFQSNFVSKLSPVTCSSNSNGKCNFPKVRGRSIDLNHPNGLELVFMFDSSSSIGEKNFKEALEFACHLVTILGVDYGNGGTRIAAITYSTRATLAFNLGQENVNSVEKACKELNSIRYSGGGTGTRYGFSLVLSEVKPLFREGSNRALILIADGKSNFGGSPETIARLLRKRDNVEIFALGVGFKVNNAELKLIASEGAGHVFKIKEYDNFHLMSEIMIKWDYSKCGKGGPTGRGYGRIFNGVKATNENGTQWPWHVAIFLDIKKNSKHKYRCGGSLISKNIVLTAGHCIVEKSGSKLHTKENFRVIVGEIKLTLEEEDSGPWIDEKSIRVKNIFTPPGYKPTDKLRKDIAILELATPVEWSAKIRPVCLPSTQDYHIVKPGTFGYVSGFGIYSNETKTSQDLRYESLPVLPPKKCNGEDDQFCAGEPGSTKDACQGDSGGPFVVNLPKDKEETEYSFHLVGIVSHGPPCGVKTETFGHYTKVTKYLDWIRKTRTEIEKSKN